MRTTTLVVTLIGSALCCGTTPAATPTLPSVVAADLQTLAAQCIEVGGKPLSTDAVQ